jgi:hypothetical protein
MFHKSGSVQHTGEVLAKHHTQPSVTWADVMRRTCRSADEMIKAVPVPYTSHPTEADRRRSPGTTAPKERAPRSPDDLYLQLDNPLCRL